MSQPAPKLRSTCRSCADSKVKCNKKKPTCSRCEARCIPCEYVQARRPGRVPGRFARPSSHTSRSSTTSLEQHSGGMNEDQNHDALLSPASTPFGLSCACGTNMQRPDAFTSTPSDDMGWGDGEAMDIDPLKLFSLSDMVDSSPDFLATMNLMTPVVAEDLGTPDQSGRSSNKTTKSAGNEQNSLDFSYSSGRAGSSDISSLGSSSLSSLLESVDPYDYALTSYNENAPSPFHHLGDLQSDDVNQSSDISACQCMMQALGMLKTLSGPRGCTDSQTAGDDLAGEFVKNNNRDINAVLRILSCELCRHDSFLFMIMLMIATKILGRYASATSMRRESSPVNGSASSVCSLSSSTNKYTERLIDIAHALGEKRSLTPIADLEDKMQPSLREAAHRVLQELHRIQKLVTELATRCKELDRQEVRSSSSQSNSRTPAAPFRPTGNSYQQNHLATTFMATFGEEISTPLSVRTFELMIGDMRRSIAMLSVVLRGLLRNG